MCTGISKMMRKDNAEQWVQGARLVNVSLAAAATAAAAAAVAIAIHLAVVVVSYLVSYVAAVPMLLFVLYT